MLDGPCNRAAGAPLRPPPAAKGIAMPPTWSHIPAASLVAGRWRNGMGESRDIAAGRGPDGRPSWQVSLAELERDTPFSDYPGWDRIFTPVAGDPPPSLSFNGGPFQPCPLLVPHRFAGDWQTLARIPAPGRAFNVLLDRARHSARVAVLHLAASDPVSVPDATEFVLHCLDAAVAFGGQAVGPGDSLAGRGPALWGTATAPGTALLVEIRSAAG